MTQNLPVTVPQNGNRSLAASAPVALEGLDGFDTSDLLIPVRKIVQGLSRMAGADEHMGWWWDSISGEFVKTFDAVLVNARHSRALFAGGGESERPECTSRDGITGSAHGTCSQCSFNPEVDPTLWSDKNSKRCNKGYTYFMHLPDGDTFAIFTASKNNVQPMKTLHTQLSMQWRVPLFGVVVTFATKLEIEPGKKYYRILPTIKARLDADKVQEYREIANGLKTLQVRVVDDDEAAPATAPAPATGGGYDDDAPPIETYQPPVAAAGDKGMLF